MNVYSWDVNRPLKQSGRANGKIWWLAECNTYQSREDGSKKPYWNVFPEDQPEADHNWAEISETGRFLGWKNGNNWVTSSLGDPRLQRRSCWIRYQYKFLWKVIVEDPEFFFMQDCFTINWETLKVKYGDYFNECHTWEEVLEFENENPLP